MANDSRSARAGGAKRAKRKPATAPPEEGTGGRLSLQIALAMDAMARAIEEPDEETGGVLGLRWRKDLRTKIAVWESLGLEVRPIRDALSRDLTTALALAQTFETNLPRLEALRDRMRVIASTRGSPAFREFLERINSPLDLDDLEEAATALERGRTAKAPPGHPTVSVMEAGTGRTPPSHASPASPGTGRGSTGKTNGRGSTGITNGGAPGKTNGLVNGIRRERRGVTNGLTNGSGFTNGLGTARHEEDSRGSRWKVYAVALVGIALLAIPLFSESASVPNGLVQVDGLATEWNGLGAVQVTHAADARLDPDVDIVETSFALGTRSLAGYVRFGGNALVGLPAESIPDVLRVFLDTDLDPATGYAIQGIGADRMAEIYGRGGTIEASRLSRFAAVDEMDWNGWSLPVFLRTAVRGGLVEFEAPLEDLEIQAEARIHVEIQAADGTTDRADTLLATSPGRLVITQASAAAARIAPGARSDFLRITATAHDRSVVIDRLAVSVLGTASLGEATAMVPELREDGLAGVAGSLWQGKVVFDIWRTIPEGAAVSFTLSGGVAFGAPTKTLGFEVAASEDVEGDAGAVTLERAPGPAPTLSVVEAPLPGVAVDGAFEDWTPDPLPPGGGRSSVDLIAVDTALLDGRFQAYVETAGPLFAGIPVPLRYVRPEPGQPRDTDRDTVPDPVDPFPADFDNDGVADAQESGDLDGDARVDYPLGPDISLETILPMTFPAPYAGNTVSVYIGPVSPLPLTGADTLRAFLDVDGIPSVGYSVGGLYADFVVEVTGKHGRVLTHHLLAFPATASPGDGDAWVYLRDIPYAKDLSRIELEADLGASVNATRASTFFELRDALGGFDASAGLLEGPQLPSMRSSVAPLGASASLVETDGGPFAWKSERAALEAYVRGARGDEEEVLLRHGSLFLGWRTEGLGELGGRTEIPSRVATRTDGPRVVLGGFERASEQYEIAGDRVKHNVWLTEPPASTGGAYGLHGRLALPAGAVVRSGERRLDGPFSSSEALTVEHDGYRVRLEAPFAYESRRPGARVPGRYEGVVEGDRVWLSMVVPGSWLTDPARTYPVVLDPTGIIDTSTNAGSTHGPSQRNVFHDGTNFWAFYYSGSTVVYEPSADGLSWVNAKNNAFTTASMTQVSTWFHDTGSSKIVYIAGDSATASTTVATRRGTISGTTVTWGAESPVTISDFALASKRPFITRSSTAYLWVGASASTAETWRARSTNADVLSCGSSLNLDASQTAGSADTGEVMDATYDYWYEPSTPRTLGAGNWQVHFWVDTASSGSGATATAIVERVNSSCTVQQTIVNEAVVLTKGSWQQYSTAAVDPGAVTIAAGQRLLFRLAKTAGNSAATLHYNGGVGGIAETRLIHPSATPYTFAVSRSFLTDNVLAWTTRTNLLTTGAAADAVQGQMLPLGSGEVYAAWYADGTIAGKKYAGSWGSEEAIATTTAGARDRAPSAVVNSANDIQLVYVDSSGRTQHIARSDGSGTWGSATELDAGPGNLYPTLSLDTATGDLYALWISSTSQMEGKKYSGGSWSAVSLETNTVAKSRLSAAYFAGSAANIAWSWTQGSGSPWDVKFSVLSTSLFSRTVDTSTLQVTVQEQHQRKVFHDGTYFWVFYDDGVDTMYTYSADGTTWENAVNQGLTQDQASVWFHNGGTKTVYVVGDGAGTSATVAVRRGTLSGGTITWGAQATATVSAVAISTTLAFISRDTSGYLWIVSTSSPTSGNHNVGVVRSTNPDDVTAWGAITTLMAADIASDEIRPLILPQSGGAMYALWYADGAIDGRRFTGTWGSVEGIGTTTAGSQFRGPSAVVDAADNVNVVYSDSSGNVIYRQRTGSWQAPTTLDSGGGNQETTLTLDTSTGDLYAFWISSTEQIKGKVYTGGAWNVISGIDTSTTTKDYLNSPYSAASSSLVVWSWGQGTTTPFEVKVASLGVPEFSDAALPAVGVLALLGWMSLRRRRAAVVRPGSPAAGSASRSGGSSSR